jgi:hypothetical protein
MVYLADSITLGTRVRIEILKAMEKCFPGERDVMSVSAFFSMPILTVKPKEAGSRNMESQKTKESWSMDVVGVRHLKKSK